MVKKRWSWGIMIPSRRDGIGSVVLMRPVHGQLLLKVFGYCLMNHCILMKICHMPIFLDMFMEIRPIKISAANQSAFVWNGRDTGRFLLRIYAEEFLAVEPTDLYS